MSTSPSPSMWDIFRGEVETHTRILTDGFLALERDGDQGRLATLMRAAHSLKGAARIVRHESVAALAHALEDGIASAQARAAAPAPLAVQAMVEVVDLIVRLSPEVEPASLTPEVTTLDVVARALKALEDVRPDHRGKTAPPPQPVVVPADPPAGGRPDPMPGPSGAPPPPATATTRDVRITADTVTRMLALAGEAVVGQRGVEPFAARLGVVKRRVSAATSAVETLVDEMDAGQAPDQVRRRAVTIGRVLDDARAEVRGVTAALDAFALRQEALASRLYREIQATRLRPFADLAEPLPRLVRDLARDLGKDVELDVEGARTDVDRDLLTVLESSLIHAVRNAIDHGIEPPEERRAAGKSTVGRVRVSAGHRAGQLRIDISDDGRGMDLERIRRRAVESGLANAEAVAGMGEADLIALLFLPGFSTRSEVGDVSGRGVGLDVVHEAVTRIGGQVQVVNRPGLGTTLRLALPVTLSLQRALLVEVDGDPYAVPITRVERLDQVAREVVRSIEGRDYVSITTPGFAHRASDPATAPVEHVGLVHARALLGASSAAEPASVLTVVVLRDRDSLYGLVVDRLIGERTIVVRPLDPRLGEVPTVAAAGMTEEGDPLIVLDVDDLVQSMHAQRTRASPQGESPSFRSEAPAARPRVLLVDDSATAREVQREMLQAHGCDVDLASDGLEAWDAARDGHYDLVISDIDMPRLDGLGLVRRIREDARLVMLPVLIVSGKDASDDRRRGLDAGASGYLSKTAFDGEAFLRTVDALLGGDA